MNLGGVFYELELRSGNFDRAVIKADKELKDIKTTSGAAASAFDRFGKKARKAGDEVGRTGTKAKKMSGILGGMKTKIVAVVAAFLGFSQVQRLVSGAARELVALDRSMGQVRTLTDLNSTSFAVLTDRVEALSLALPKTGADLGLGLYQVLSSGVQDTGEAFDVLTVAAKLSAAGLLDTNQSVDALTTVLNAYGKSSSEATAISDIFFTTVREGKLTVPQLASTIGAVATSAALAKVPIEEVGAAMATLTKLGISAPEAATALNRFLLSVISPTEDMTKAANELGIEWNTQALAAKGLAGFMKDLAVKTGGNIDKLAKLNPNIRAARAAFVLAGTGADEFQRILGTMGESAGATEIALGKVNDTLDAQFQIVKNKLNIGIGNLIDGALPSIIRLGEALARVLLTSEQLVDLERDRRLSFLESIGVDVSSRRREFALEDIRGDRASAEGELAGLDIGDLGPAVARSLDAAIDDLNRGAVGRLGEIAGQRLREAIESEVQAAGAAIDELGPRIDEAIGLNLEDRTRLVLESGQDALAEKTVLEDRIARLEKIAELMAAISQAAEDEHNVLISNVKTQEDQTEATNAQAKAVMAIRTAVVDLGLVGENLFGPLAEGVTVPIRMDLTDFEEFQAELEGLDSTIAEALEDGAAEGFERAIQLVRTREEEFNKALLAAKSGRGSRADRRAAGDARDRAVIKLEQAYIELKEAIRRAREEKEGLEDDEGLRKIGQEIEATARGVLRLADAFGMLDDGLRKTLEGAIELGSAIAKIAAGDITPGTIIQGLGGIASIVSGLKGQGNEAIIAANKDLADRILELQRAMIELKDAIVAGEGVSRKDISQGSNLLSTLGALFDAAGGDNIGDRARNFGSNLARSPELLQQLAALEQITGIDIIDRLLSGDFNAIFSAIQEATNALNFLDENLGQINFDTVAGQMRFFQLMIDQLDLTEASDQLRFFMEEIAEKFIPGLNDALSGFDLGTEEGRSAAGDFIAGIARELAEQGLTDRIQGIFGSDVNPGEILSILGQLDQLLGGGSAGGNQSISKNVQITEAKAGRLLAMTATQVTRLEQLVEMAAERNSMLAIIAGLGDGIDGSRPGRPGDPELAGFRGGGVTIENIDIASPQITLLNDPSSTEEARQAGQSIGEGIVEGIDAQLQVRSQQARRLAGQI